jgi:tetratricopeptide (TPR) repeat protein
MKKLTAILILTFFPFGWSHDELADQRAVITAKIQKEPQRADLYFQRAELFRADSHWKKAEADYKTARKLSPDMNVTDLGLGLVYLQTGQLKESKAALDRFLEAEPSHAEGRVTRGHASSRLGLIDEAIQDYTEALVIRPDPEIFIERARLFASQNKLNEAVDGLDEGVGRLGPVVTLELAAIEYELQLKRHESALSRVEKIAAQSDRKETWLLRKGEILEHASRAEEAKKAFLAAAEAIEKLPEARRNNRYTQELQLKIKGALERLQKARVE